MSDARKELNMSVREGRKESRHSFKCLVITGSRSHDFTAEVRMHSVIADCDTFFK